MRVSNLPFHNAPRVTPIFHDDNWLKPEATSGFALLSPELSTLHKKAYPPSDYDGLRILISQALANQLINL